MEFLCHRAAPQVSKIQIYCLKFEILHKVWNQMQTLSFLFETGHIPYTYDVFTLAVSGTATGTKTWTRKNGLYGFKKNFSYCT